MIPALALRSRRRRRGPNSGEAAVEFALVSVVLFLLLFGIIGAALLMWTQNALQEAASRTARCVAIGSTDCATPATYARGLISGFTFAGLGNAATVAVSTGTTCPSNTSPTGSITASYEIVKITSAFWANGLLPPPLSGITLSATACYPVSAS